MNFAQSFSMAIKAMLRNKGRSFLTMLGIIIGVSAVVILVSIMQHATKQVTEEMSSMGTTRVGISYNGTKDITQDFFSWCQRHPNLVSGVSTESNTSGTLKHVNKSHPSSVYFGTESFDICENLKVESGGMFNRDQVDARSRVCVLGSKARDELFNYVDPLGKTILINNEEFTVLGVFKAQVGGYGLDDMVLVPYTHQRLLMKKTAVQSFTVNATTTQVAKETVSALNEYFLAKAGSSDKYYVSSMGEYIEQVNQMTGMLSLVLGGIAGISLLVGGIGIMNIMLVSITERTREIGIRRAIGAKRRYIVIQFLIESGTVSALGGIVGLLLGTFGTLVGGKYIFKEIVLPSVGMMIGSFVFAAVIGIFFGFYPAWRAAKLSPIDALRSE